MAKRSDSDSFNSDGFQPTRLYFDAHGTDSHPETL